MTKRECGDCQLCCRLVPVAQIGKPAGQRCVHQRYKLGCVIYPNRPLSCAAWSCAWLADDDADVLRRPDRCNYVVDMMLDYVVKNDNNTGESQTIPVLQIWCDPKFPKAWQDNRLLNFLNKKGGEGLAAMIRLSSNSGFLLLPPAMTHDHQFLSFEGATDVRWDHQHSHGEINRVLTDAGIGYQIAPVNKQND